MSFMLLNIVEKIELQISTKGWFLVIQSVLLPQMHTITYSNQLCSIERVIVNNIISWIQYSILLIETDPCDHLYAEIIKLNYWPGWPGSSDSFTELGRDKSDLSWTEGHLYF